jgi:protocatechuate 3,4-dioxygenase beta subunit
MTGRALCGTLFVAMAAVCFAQTAQDADKLASVEGMVNHALSGEPMVRAHVVLRGNSAGTQRLYGTQTTAEGKFSLTGVAAGNYVLTVDKTGFVMPPGADFRVSVVLKEKDKKDGIKLKLLPTGAITGSVTDADGQPVEGASVTAEGRTGEVATSDETGHFRLGGLSPGKYRVRAALRTGLSLPPEIRTDGTQEAHYATTYYPGVLSAREAARVEVRPDGESPGADIRLQKIPWVRVSGRILGLAPGSERVMVMARQDPAGMRGGQDFVQAHADGSFDMWRLDAGKYRLRALWSTPANQNFQTVEEEVNVAGANVENIELRMVPDSDIPGRIEFDDDAAKQLLQPPAQGSAQQSAQVPANRQPSGRPMLTLRETGTGIGPGGPIAIDETGAFQIRKLPAGRYRLVFSGTPLYVKSMRLGSANVDGAVLELRNGSGGADLSILASSAVGSLSGTVADDNGSVAGTRIFLKGEGADDMFSRRYASTGPDGKYQFANLPPGNYKVLAVAESDADTLTNPGALDDYADLMETVAIHPGDKAEKDLKRRTPGQP